MKKHILASIIAFSLLPITTYAISLHEIESNSDQYVFLIQNKASVTYVSNNSIQSLRYSPPYYSLCGKFYGVSYIDNIILECDLTVCYNKDEGTKYNNRMIDKISDTISQNLSSSNTQDDFNNQMETSIKSIYNNDTDTDNGMIAKINRVREFDFDGNLITEFSPDTIENISINTPTYHVANYMFHKYYNEYFVSNLGINTY